MRNQLCDEDATTVSVRLILAIMQQRTNLIHNWLALAERLSVIFAQFDKQNRCISTNSKFLDAFECLHPSPPHSSCTLLCRLPEVRSYVADVMTSNKAVLNIQLTIRREARDCCYLSGYYPVCNRDAQCSAVMIATDISDYHRMSLSLSSPIGAGDLPLEGSGPHGFLGLTERQMRVFKLIGEGKTSKEIACALEISILTVGTHRKNILRKLDMHSTAELASTAASASRLALPDPSR